MFIKWNSARHVSLRKWHGSFLYQTDMHYIMKDLKGLDSALNPNEKWCKNPVRALAQVGFLQHLEYGIHLSEFGPEESFALIPHLVAR